MGCICIQALRTECFPSLAIWSFRLLSTLACLGVISAVLIEVIGPLSEYHNITVGSHGYEELNAQLEVKRDWLEVTEVWTLVFLITNGLSLFFTFQALKAVSDFEAKDEETNRITQAFLVLIILDALCATTYTVAGIFLYFRIPDGAQYDMTDYVALPLLIIVIVNAVLVITDLLAACTCNNKRRYEIKEPSCNTNGSVYSLS